MKLNNKKGFSLVELSIVLIIVALLIAGVISGKSLINNSKMNVINSEVNTLKIAIRSYLDNNGITDYVTTDGSVSAPDNEGKYENNFFNKLVEEGYLDEHKNFASSDICYPSKISGGCWYYKYDQKYERFVLTLANKADSEANSIAILDKKLCTQFGTKFASGNGASDASKHGATESNSTEDDNKKHKLNVYFYDIFA